MYDVTLIGTIHWLVSDAGITKENIELANHKVSKQISQQLYIKIDHSSFMPRKFCLQTRKSKDMLSMGQ